MHSMPTRTARIIRIKATMGTAPKLCLTMPLRTSINNDHIDIKYIQTAGRNDTSQTYGVLTPFFSHTEMPMRARAARSWFEAPKVFQKVLHAEMIFPFASVPAYKRNTMGTSAVRVVPMTLPLMSFQPVNSSMM